MELRRELLLTIGALICMNLLLAFGTIGLLVRMGPAIEQILQENVISIVAAEEILAEIAVAGVLPMTPQARLHVEQALDRAAANVTEAAERPVLHAIKNRIAAAMEADVGARADVVRDVRALIEINHEAMRDVDAEALRLGTSGAWAAVLVGFLSFAMSLVAVSRLRRRFLRPLEELHEVLEAARAGNRLRRCRGWDAPHEVRQVIQSVNRLLDERWRAAAPVGYDRSHGALEVGALRALLEQQPGGAAVVGPAGELVCANRDMLAGLAGDAGPRLRRALGGDEATIEQLTRIAVGGHGWLCMLPDPVSSELAADDG